MAVLTVTDDLDGGLILEVTEAPTAREYAYYKTSVSAANILAITNLPTYHYPHATAGTYYCVVKDSAGTTLATLSASGTPTGNKTFLTDDTDMIIGAYDYTNTPTKTLPLPRTAKLHRVSVVNNSAGGYNIQTGNAIVSTRPAGEKWKPRGIASIIDNIIQLSASPILRESRVPYHTLYYPPYRFTSTTTDYQKPFLAYIKNGEGIGWIADAISYYAFWSNAATLNIFTGGAYGDAKSMTDTKLAMDAAHTFVIPRMLKTIPESLVILDTAIAELKDTYPELDQAFVLKVLMIWARSFDLNGSTVTTWGSLSLAEIQALNAQGASISESLAGVSLLWNNETHVEVMQKYWWFKIQSWFSGLSNVTCYGFDKLDDADDSTPDIGEKFSSGFKTWFDANVPNGCLVSHQWTNTTYAGSDPATVPMTKPSSDNAHITYRAATITFKDATSMVYDVRKTVRANQFVRMEQVRGHQLEIPEYGSLFVPSEDELIYNVRITTSALESVGAFSAPLFSYQAETILALYNTQRARDVYHYICECLFNLPHEQPMIVNYATQTSLGSDRYRIAVSGIDVFTDEVKVDLRQNTLTNTNIDYIQLGGQLIDIDLRLEMPTGYLLSYDKNAEDATGEMDSETTFTATIRANEFTREGYTFTGWNTAFDGSGMTYQPNDELTLTADTVLYAQWAEFTGLPIFVEGKQVLEMYAGGKRVLKMYVDGKTVFE